MALDYYLEIDEYGTQDQLDKLRSFIRNEFSFPEDKETKIMLGNGLGINFGSVCVSGSWKKYQIKPAVLIKKDQKASVFAQNKYNLWLNPAFSSDNPARP